MVKAPGDARLPGLEVSVDAGDVAVVLPGPPPAEVARGFAERNVADLVAGLTHLGPPRGVVDGVPVRGIATFAVSQTDLAAGRLPDGRIALIFRSSQGDVVGRVDVEPDELAALVRWLRSLLQA